MIFALKSVNASWVRHHPGNGREDIRGIREAGPVGPVGHYKKFTMKKMVATGGSEQFLKGCFDCFVENRL